MTPYDDALRRIVVPRLSALGFARRGTSWMRRRRAVRVEVIDFQRSMNNTSDGARFTVNIGLAPISMAGADGWIALSGCPIRQRIGGLRPEHKDHWYRYLPEDRASTDAAITEAMADIDIYVLPFFAQRPWREREAWLVAAQFSRLLPRRSGAL